MADRNEPPAFPDGPEAAATFACVGWGTGRIEEPAPGPPVVVGEVDDLVVLWVQHILLLSASLIAACK